MKKRNSLTLRLRLFFLISLCLFSAHSHALGEFEWQQEWVDIRLSTRYQSASEEWQRRVHDAFFERRVAPTLSINEIDLPLAKSYWNSSYKPTYSWKEAWEIWSSSEAYLSMPLGRRDRHRKLFFELRVALAAPTVSERKKAREMWNQQTKEPNPLTGLLYYLFVLLICYPVYHLISGHPNIFEKPEQLEKRPRWFFGFGVYLMLTISILTPITGTLEDDVTGRAVLRIFIFLLAMIIVVIMSLIYRASIRKKISRRATSDPGVGDLDDEWFFRVAEMEFRVRRTEGLWLKAMALEGGDETRAKYRYIKLRAEQLATK